MSWVQLNLLVCDLTSTNTDAATIIIPVLRDNEDATDATYSENAGP